jgi:hypothetical protein
VDNPLISGVNRPRKPPGGLFVFCWAQTAVYGLPRARGVERGRRFKSGPDHQNCFVSVKSVDKFATP